MRSFSSENVLSAVDEPEAIVVVIKDKGVTAVRRGCGAESH
jgi:hypothetical protein